MSSKPFPVECLSEGGPHPMGVKNTEYNREGETKAHDDTQSNKRYSRNKLNERKWEGTTNLMKYRARKENQSCSSFSSSISKLGMLLPVVSSSLLLVRLLESTSRSIWTILIGGITRVDSFFAYRRIVCRVVDHTFFATVGSVWRGRD